MQLLLEILLYRFSFLQNRYVSFNFYEKWLNFHNWFQKLSSFLVVHQVSIVVVSPFISSGSGSQTGCALESPGELFQNLVPGALASGILITQVSMELRISGFLEDSPRLVL